MDDLLETLGQYLPIYTPSAPGSMGGGSTAESQMQVANYKTQLEQYLKDKERWQQEQDASRLGAVSAQIFDNQKGLGAAQDLDNQTKYSNFMTRELVKAGPVAMDAVLKMMTQQQGAFARGGVPTNNEKDFAAMQANPAMYEYMQQRNQATAPAAIQIAQMLSDPAVPEDVKQNLRYAQKIDRSVENAGQVAQATALGSVEGGATKPIVEQFGKEYNTVQENEQNAVRLTDTVKAIDQEFGDSYTGAFGDDVTKIQKIAKALNIPVDPNLGNKEAAEALANQLALQLRSPAEGGGMPGSLSDTDREFLRSMTPGALMTREGRKELIDRYTKISARASEMANEADKYIHTSKNGSLDTGWNVQRRAMKQRWDAEDKAAREPPAPAVSAVTSPREGQRQRNPKTGQIRIFTNGQWVIQ